MPDNTKITIRPAVPVDAEELSALAARTFHATFAPYNTPENMEAHAVRSFSTARQLDEITSDHISTFVGVKGSIVCFAQIRKSDAPTCVTAAHPLELWRFYVDQPYHGLGIAQQLMQTVLTHASALRADTVWLGVWENNPRAMKFYIKCGFIDAGSHTFHLGDDTQTDRIMTRDLPGTA